MIERLSTHKQLSNLLPLNLGHLLAPAPFHHHYPVILTFSLRPEPNPRNRELIRRDTISGHKIDRKRISPRTKEKPKRNRHALCRRIIPISRNTQQRRNTSAARNTTHNKARAAFRVLAQTTHAQRHDGREDDALEEQRDVQHGHTRVSALRYGWTDEDYTHGQVGNEDPAWFHEFHDQYTCEAA